MTLDKKYDFTRYDEYIAYFREFAIDHPAFVYDPQKHKSFFLWKMEDFDRHINDLDLKLPALLLEEPDSTYNENAANYFTDRQLGAIVVIDRVTDRTDIAEEIEVKARLKKLASVVLAKLYYDKYKLRVAGFNPNDAKGNFLGPMWDNHFGYRIEFAIQEFATDSVLDNQDFTQSIYDDVASYASSNGFTITTPQAVFDTIYKMRRI